jgi:anti-sigma regulatory factor (Ser/Thr protein kinase)
MSAFQIREWVDCLHVQRAAAQFASRVGFDRRSCQELAIVASELTSNVLKYGPPGRLELSEISGEFGPGMKLTATDSGPPFRDLTAALKDGYDDAGPIDPLAMLKRRGIGGGLGAVVRFSDSLEVEPHVGGKKIHVVRYLRQPSQQRRRS